MYSDWSLRRFLPALLLSGALLSCTVLEDRTECPCLLTLDLSGVDAGALPEGSGGALTWVVQTADFSLSGQLPLEALPASHSIEVPRERLSLRVFCGDDSLYDSGGLAVPEGSESPPLLLFRATVDGTLPEQVVPVTLHKRYALLEVDLGELAREGDGSRLSLLGDYCGYDPGGDPLPGVFRLDLAADPSGCCRVRLPAQPDGGVRLCVYRYGELERIFSLGTYLREAGYDWTAEDLADIRVKIDYVTGAVRFQIDQTSKSSYFTIVV